MLDPAAKVIFDPPFLPENRLRFLRICVHHFQEIFDKIFMLLLFFYVAPTRPIGG